MSSYADSRKRQARPLVLLDTVERAVYRLEVAVAIASLATMLLAVATTVVVRFFDLPIPNLGEIALAAAAALTFIGGGLCSYLGAHIAVDISDQIPRPWLRCASRILADLCVAVFGGFFMVVAWGFFHYAWTSGERLIDLGTPLTLPGAFMVVGAGLFVFHSLADLIRIATGHAHPGKM